MSKLLKCKIDVMKIDKSRLFKGEKGTYLDIDVWIADETDKYGNNVSIQQQTKKDEQKIYIGNGKVKDFEKAAPVENNEGKYTKSGKVDVKAMSDPQELPDDNMPF